MISTMSAHLLRSPLTILLVIALLLAGCRKGEPTGPGGGGGGGGVPHELNVSFMFNGQQVTFNDPDGYIAGSSEEGPWSYFGAFDLDQGMFQLAIGSIEGEEQPSAAQFTSLFTPGPRDYYETEPFPGVAEMGVWLMYFDPAEEVFWVSFGPQEESDLTITAIESISGAPTDQVWVKGTFNATLYDLLTFESKDVTGGTFTLRFDNI
jgi:hypothetical protein